MCDLYEKMFGVLVTGTFSASVCGKPASSSFDWWYSVSGTGCPLGGPYFEKITAHGMRVGLSCGFTLYQTVHALRERRLRDLVLYPLSGESTLKLVDTSPNTLVGMAAAKYRPHVTAYALPVQHLQS